MRTGECELRLRVPAGSIRGRPEAILRVAQFALVLVRRRGKLTGMRIGVTIHAN